MSGSTPRRPGAVLGNDPVLTGGGGSQLAVVARVRYLSSGNYSRIGVASS